MNALLLDFFKKRSIEVPPPFKGMLAISSDVEFTSWQAQLDLIEIFGSRGLECGFSYWCFGDGSTTWRLFEDDNQPSIHAAAGLSLARAGILDTLHSFGGVTDGSGCFFDRERMAMALEYLASKGVKTRVYANHGTTDDTQNIGGAWATYQEGDLPDSSKYHLDLSDKFGLKFFWTDIDYSNNHPYFELQHSLDRSLITPQVSRDGTPILRFKRFRGPFNRAPYAGNIEEQLALVFSKKVAGYSILYQHLGVARNQQGVPKPNSPPYFTKEGFDALDKLSKLQAQGVLLVTTAERLLMYVLLMSAKPWSVKKGRQHIEVVFQKKFVFEGVSFELNRNDLDGWAMLISDNKSVQGNFDGDVWEVPKVSYGKNTYAMIPWRKIDIINELERAKSLV